ncbi:MAG: GNAT family N-acetyltransferase [Thermomicrobiales bacterium]
MTESDRRSIVLRPATLADVPSIAGIHVRVWQRSYRGIMPDDFLDALAPEHRYERWEREVAAPNAAMTVIVAEDPVVGQIVGFCSVCPQNHREPVDEALPAAGELYTMYVDEKGRGIGRCLIEAAEARMRAMGFTRGVLWMLADNVAARSFYERMGWGDGIHSIRRSFRPGNPACEDVW